MSEYSIVKSVFIKAPSSDVWRFLTDKKKLATWFHEGEDDVSESGVYALLSDSPDKAGTRLIWGQVLEFTPTSRLVHTFTHDSLAGIETTCVWELTDVEGGTILRLTHSGFEKADNGFNQAADHDAGWDEHFARLRQQAN
ncbi:MAG: SRPBCC domain-containing protein [Pseudomonadota bacterium]